MMIKKSNDSNNGAASACDQFSRRLFSLHHFLKHPQFLLGFVAGGFALLSLSHLAGYTNDNKTQQSHSIPSGVQNIPSSLPLQTIWTSRTDYQHHTPELHDTHWLDDKNAKQFTHPTYCPYATCHNTELCLPCRRRFLIIIASGRSASTTLTWMLDSLPGVRMSGENNDAMGHFRKLVNSTLRFHKFVKDNAGQKCAWCHNVAPPQTESCVAQAVIEMLSPPNLLEEKYIANPHEAATDIVGFKTVRFFQDAHTLQDEQELAQYLIHHFPCARIIVNYHSDVVSQAQFMKRKPKFREEFKGVPKDDVIQILQEENDKMKRLVDTLGPDRAVLLDRAEWTQDISKLNEVVTWLGFKKECHFPELLEFNINHGYGKGKTELQMHPDCTPI